MMMINNGNKKSWRWIKVDSILIQSCGPAGSILMVAFFLSVSPSSVKEKHYKDWCQTCNNLTELKENLSTPENRTALILYGPSVFAVKAKIYGVLYKQFSSIAFDETSSYWSVPKTS